MYGKHGAQCLLDNDNVCVCTWVFHLIVCCIFPCHQSSLSKHGLVIVQRYSLLHFELGQ